MFKHSAPGYAAGRAPIGYKGNHRAPEPPPGFAPHGQVTDRIRTEPELMALERQPADRGERPNLDITDRWYPRELPL